MTITATEAGRKCQQIHGTDHLERRIIGDYCHECERYVSIRSPDARRVLRRYWDR